MQQNQCRRMLEEGYLQIKKTHDDLTRLEFLGEYIFDFTTYDTQMSELFATKALEVCAAVSAQGTFEYIKNPENHQWYLLLCNTPFFAKRINWGTSIRGAWWDAPITLATCALWLDGKQLRELQFSDDGWREFVSALADFSPDFSPPRFLAGNFGDKSLF